jgi:hypothetical protein
MDPPFSWSPCLTDKRASCSESFTTSAWSVFTAVAQSELRAQTGRTVPRGHRVTLPRARHSHGPRLVRVPQIPEYRLSRYKDGYGMYGQGNGVELPTPSLLSNR